MRPFIIFVLTMFLPTISWAAESGMAEAVNLTSSVYGYMGLLLFVVAYALVPFENKIHLRKSKPFMLAVGSAAGVAMMGTARGIYTFGSHLKWAPAIALGYVLSILCHLVINARLF